MYMEKGYNINQTAELLGITPRTAREWVRKNKIRANKISDSERWIVMESEILRLQKGISDIMCDDKKLGLS